MGHFSVKKNNSIFLYWTAIAIICFFFFQWYSIYFRLYNLPCPIGLSDSDFYISRINYYKTHKLFSFSKMHEITKEDFSSANENVRFLHMFYSAPCFYLLAKLSNISGHSPKEIFHYSFYIGIFMMGIALFLIFKQMGQSPYKYFVGFIIFTFYTGRGSYHGFFWVTPSFYCLLFWLLLFWIIFYTNYWKILSPVLLYFVIFSHPMGFFAVASILGSIFLYGLLTKTISNEVKRIVFLCAVTFIIFVIYKTLLHYNFIMPMITEGSGMEKKWAFDCSGFELLVNDTPFLLYFFGLFLPLTINGIYFCFIKKEYKILSLFLITFTGTTLLSSMHLRGMRTFIFLEISLLLVIVYGLQYNLHFFLSLKQTQNNTIRKNFNAKFIGNIFILSLAIALILFFFKTRIIVDYVSKFQHIRIWQSESMEKYINMKYPHNPLVFIGSDYDLLSVLSFNEWWDKTIFFPAIMDTKNTILPNSSIIIGKNYKLYQKSRSGIGVFFPQNSEIHLNTGLLEPGRYKLSFKDSNIKSFEKNIRIFSPKESILSQNWLENPYDVKRNIKGVFPFLMPPWYTAFSKMTFFKRKFNFPVARKASNFSTIITINNKINGLVVKNISNLKHMVGIITLINLDGNIIVFRLDIDRDSKEEIDQKTSFVYRHVHTPLLWQDSSYPLYSNNQKEKPFLFVLEKNFGDIKLFKPFVKVN